MKNFRGSALAAGVGTPESAPHELQGSSLHFYLRFKHRNCFGISYKYSKINPSSLARQYIPKGSDFDLYSEENLAEIEWKLNQRPGKLLCYLTPLDYFKKLYNFDFGSRCTSI